MAKDWTERLRGDCVSAWKSDPRSNTSSWIHLGTGTVALVINATLGAIVLLILLRLINGVAAGDGVAVSVGVGNSSAHALPWAG